MNKSNIANSVYLVPLMKNRIQTERPTGIMEATPETTGSAMGVA